MPKLLLADDSVTIQRVIELTFADEDVQILTAGDGEQAIQRIQTERPDVVLADIAMPKQSGYDVAAFVKGTPELAHIPVLLLAGAFEPVDEAKARAAGSEGVLVKPFEPQHVISRVRELLQRGAAGGAGAPPVAPPSGGGRVADSERPRTATESALDDYFDRLDAAFANMSAGGGGRRPPDTVRRDGPVLERDLDWFDTPHHRSSAVDSPNTIGASPLNGRAGEPVPVTFASPPGAPPWQGAQPPTIEPPDGPREIAPQSATFPGNSPAPLASTGSAIADAFSALLAAEHGEPGATPVRVGVPGPSPAVTEELVDEITRRVLQRLSAQHTRDLVADIVSDVAERLVREEIERIRSRRG